eukprot:6429747-Prymnesium_polylepis.1
MRRPQSPERRAQSSEGDASLAPFFWRARAAEFSISFFFCAAKSRPFPFPTLIETCVPFYMAVMVCALCARAPSNVVHGSGSPACGQDPSITPHHPAYALGSFMQSKVPPVVCVAPIGRVHTLPIKS